MDENQLARRLLALLQQNPDLNLGEAIERSGANIDRSRITQFRHYRGEEAQNIALKLLVPAMIEVTNLAVPAMIEVTNLAVPALILKEGDLKPFSTLSILYSTLENTPARCACTQGWQRVRNRCYPICDRASATGRHIYSSLEACQSASEPPFPDPEGEDNGRGGGGYWKVWTGHKQGTWNNGRNSYDYSENWSGGAFYPSFDDVCVANLNYVSNLFAPVTWVRDNPLEFPSSVVGSSPAYTYFNLQLSPKLNMTSFGGRPVSIQPQKRVIGTTNDFRVSQNGWFVFFGFNYDLYFFDNNSWLHPDNTAFAFCYVGKYQQAEDESEPPSNILGFNIAGVTPFYNPVHESCKYREDNTDSTCPDPGNGNPVTECPYPQDRRARKIWVGGSKEPPLGVGLVHFSDKYDGYVVATEARKLLTSDGFTIASKETVRLFSSPESAQAWCRIESIDIDGRSISSTEVRHPVVPPELVGNWKKSLSIYDGRSPGNIPETELPTNSPSINKYRSDKEANIISIDGEKTLAKVNLAQKAFDTTREITSNLIQVVSTRDLNKETIVCLSPFLEGSANTKPSKGYIADKVYKIHAPEKVMGASAWVDRVNKAYEAAKLPCDRMLKLFCEKVIFVSYSGSGNLELEMNVKPGNSFAGSGKVEVWRTRSDNPSVTDRVWVNQLSSTQGTFTLRFPGSFSSIYDGIFFICRNPEKGNDTCNIDWDFQTLTVTLKSF